MKIRPLTPRKLERLCNSVRIETPQNNKYTKIIKSTHNAEYNCCRMNLERFAEEMKPQEYLEARRYLSSIEMQELLRGDIL